MIRLHLSAAILFLLTILSVLAILFVQRLNVHNVSEDIARQQVSYLAYKGVVLSHSEIKHTSDLKGFRVCPPLTACAYEFTATGNTVDETFDMAGTVCIATDKTSTIPNLTLKLKAF